MESGPRDPVLPRAATESVVGKVRAILDALARSDGVVGLSELARRSGVAKASVHRLCGELVDWGVVERSGDAFRLGPRLFELGSRVPGRRQLREAALPFMEDLASVTRETVHLAVLDGDEVLYVERLPGRASRPVPSSVADRLPLHCTATGRCLLAHGPDELLQRVLASPMEARTPASVTTAEGLSAVLEEVRRSGVAIERGEVADGLMSVGAPVFGLGGAVAGALSVTGDLSRLDVASLADLVRLAAAGLSRRLGAPECRPVR